MQDTTITEGQIISKRQRKETLRKAAALQKAIFNSATFSSITTDEKGVIQIFNVGAERMLGYSAAEVVNKITPAEISDPEEVIARAKALSQELQTPIAPEFEALVFKASRGIEDVYELTYIRKDGSRFPAVVSVTALRDSQDAIIGYLLIGTDNSAGKQAEKALLKAGALQNAIFNSAYFSCIATDEKGVIQLFNVGAERMLGYSAYDVLNKITPADLHDSEEVISRAKALSLELGIPIKSGFETLIFKASRGIADIYELTKIRKDGSRFPAIVSVTALRDGRAGIIGYLLIGTDNTVGKLAEEAAARLVAIVNFSNDAIIGQDLNSRVTSWNRGAEKLFGYSASEMVGNPIMRLVPPDRQQEELKTISLVQNGESVEHFETVIATKDGHLVDIAVTVSFIKDKDGKIVEVSRVARDITERKAAEAKILELNAELESRVLQRTAELEVANKELEAFSYSVSHDLRAPLRAVDGFSQAVLEDYSALLPFQGQHYLRTIREGAQLMGTLIDDLLAFSRLSRAPLNKQTLNTFNLVQRVLKEMNSEIQARSIEIRVGELPSCQGDSALLKQVWANLLSNAIKYTRGRNPSKIEIGCKTDQESVYYVRDNGAGFDMKYAHKLFGVFQRLHRSDQFEGTGVGLAIVQQVIHRHGGRIWAEAATNGGATFYFTLKEK